MATVTVTRSEKEGLLDGRAGDFEVEIDRGEVNSPRSIELLMLGLGACTVATVQHYMNRKGMPVSGLGAEVKAEFNSATNAYDDFKIVLSVGDGLTEAERQILLGIAKSCRIHKTLTSDLDIEIALMAPAGGIVQSEERSV